MDRGNSMVGDVKQKSFKRQILRSMIVLAIPTVIEQILSTLLQYVDTAMVGKLGEQATAAVSVTTTVNWLISSVPEAAAVAMLAMVSREVGRKDEKAVESISKLAVFLTLICGIFLTAVSVAVSPFVPSWMGAELSVRHNASMYFLILSCSRLFRCATSIFGAAIRAVKDTRTPLFIGMGANALNVVLNILFIYHLHMGVIGAAIASTISYTFSGILMYQMFRHKKGFNWKWKDFAVDTGRLKQCVRIGLPVFGTGASSCFGYVVFAGLVSGMGTTVFAAHSIAVTAETIFYIPGYGLRSATSTMVGIALGEQDKRKFETVSSLSIGLTMVLMCFTGGLLYLTAYPLMGLMTSSRNVAALGAEMLRIVAFTEPFFGLMIVMEGILYGLGRTRYAFVVESIGMWGVRIIFTALCVKVWNMDLRAVWYCMIADNICKAVLLAVPVISRKRREQLFAGR